MSFFDDLGIRAAEQLESSVGPFVALASYKRLLAGPEDIRARALIGALRCAIALEDDKEVAAAVNGLAAIPASAPSAIPYAVDLLTRGKIEHAVQLAGAESQRTKSPIAHYVHARATEAARATGLDVCALWESVADAAVSAGDAAVQAQSASRFVGACLQRARRDAASELPRGRIATLCETAAIHDLGTEQKLLVLRGRLLSGSNFQRASALSAVEEIARKAAEPMRRMAIDLAARHLDAMPFHLHAIEIDRVRATIRRLTDEGVRTRLEERMQATLAVVSARSAGDPSKTGDAIDVLVRISPMARAGLARLRAADHGGDLLGAPAPSTVVFDELAALGVHALVSLRKDANDTDHASAVEALTRAAPLLGPDNAVPIPLWAAARAAIGSGRSVVLRDAGVKVLGAAFARTTSFPPPKLVDLAAELGRASAHRIANIVLDEATRLREPEARAASADHARRVAYDALARGDREGAWKALQSARALFQ